MPSKIMRCKCSHEGQDKLHGPGMRVFNAHDKKPGEYSCTVCGVTGYLVSNVLKTRKK